MPTKREREYYRMGFQDGQKSLYEGGAYLAREPLSEIPVRDTVRSPRRPKRKLSAGNKYVKANSKNPRFRMRSGKLNLKKMAVAFRKTPAGKKKRR